jgi:hypothetical protein
MDSRRRSPAAAILGIVGGATMVVGSLLTWAVVELDVDRFAKALGVDASAFRDLGVRTSIDVAGTDVGGKISLVLGILCLVAAGLLLLAGAARRTSAGLLVLGGLAGTALCLYEIASKDRQIDEALSGAGSQLEQIGLSATTFRSVFSVEWASGLWIALAGGVIAAIAGIVGLMGSDGP